MAATRSPADSMALMARETRWHYGPVPRELGGQPIPADSRLFAQGQFVLRTLSGYGYHYVPGEGITIEQPEAGDPEEEALWLSGSVYAAAACLNGFFPLHASAIAHQGQVMAFTGATGAGKSTLVAALGQRGWPMFCDDTLLLDLADPDRIMALPGHKRLKLTAEALAMLGIAAEQPVGADTGKSYAAPPAGDWCEPLPLTVLVFLEDGEEPNWLEVAGAARFARLADDHYTRELYLEAQRPDRASQFGLRSRLAGQIAMARLVRPRSAASFAASLDLAEARLQEMGREFQP